MKSRPSRALLQRLQQRLEAEPHTPSWAVAYSGGRDSGVLLALTCQLFPGRVTALHIDHGWRSVDERASELALVSKVCASRGATLVTLGPPESGAPATNREVAARQFRYACFDRFSQEHPNVPILLAHHAQDQVETTLMRLLQGRSWQGLGGMSARRGVFRRPLLDVWPDELDAVARDLELPYWNDSSNDDLSLARNALRRELLPALEARFPGAARSLYRFGRVWRQLQPPTSIDEAWELGAHRARLPRRVWDSWTALEQGNQLLGLAGRWQGGRVPRRLVDSLLEGGRAGAWSLTRETPWVTWECVVKVPRLQYFREVAEAQAIDVGTGEVLWSRTVGDVGLGWGNGGFDPVVLATSDTVVVRDWARRVRHHLTSHQRQSLERCVFWVAGGEVRGAFDPEDWQWCWTAETASGAPKFWVTLRRRVYERRR